MVRRTGNAQADHLVIYDVDDDDDDYNEEDDDDEEYGSKKKPKAKSPAKKSKSPRGKAKSPGNKAPAKKAAAKTTKRTPSEVGRLSGRARNNVSYVDEEDDDDNEEEADEDYSEDDYSDDEPQAKRKYSPKKVQRGRPPAAKTSGEKIPTVKDMVIQSIRALRDNPRKGSTLGSIKQVMELNWPVNTKALDSKIKKYIECAVKVGEIIQTRGSGARGRFTLPGFKVKRRKKPQKVTQSLGEKYDEDVVEYSPTKTERDEQREKDLELLERKRLERKLLEEKVKAEKAATPKKSKPKKEVFEVEMIKGKREVGGKTYYLVKFIGWKKPQWEPEDNVRGSEDLVIAYEKETEQKRKEVEERRLKEEREGAYEVARIIEVKFKKGKETGGREFLIRWKGHGPEFDSWEPEEHLDCHQLIDAFMAKWESRVQIEEKSLRVAPKRVERLNFARSNRLSKRNMGARVTYEDMDE